MMQFAVRSNRNPKLHCSTARQLIDLGCRIPVKFLNKYPNPTVPSHIRNHNEHGGQRHQDFVAGAPAVQGLLYDQYSDPIFPLAVWTVLTEQAMATEEQNENNLFTLLFPALFQKHHNRSTVRHPPSPNHVFVENLPVKPYFGSARAAYGSMVRINIQSGFN